MVEGRMRQEWNHTSQILRMIHNVNRPPDSAPVDPFYYHPYMRKPEAAGPPPKVPLKELKGTLMGNMPRVVRRAGREPETKPRRDLD